LHSTWHETRTIIHACQHTFDAEYPCVRGYYARSRRGKARRDQTAQYGPATRASAGEGVGEAAEEAEAPLAATAEESRAARSESHHFFRRRPMITRMVGQLL